MPHKNASLIGFPSQFHFGWRWLAIASVALGEIFVISFFFSFPTTLSEWANPLANFKKLVQAGFLSLIAFLIISWPIRDQILNEWHKAAATHNWRLTISTNVGLFGVLLVATIALSNLGPEVIGPFSYWIAAYCSLLLITGISLILLIAPLSFWHRLLKLAPSKVALSLLSACAALLASEIAKGSWTSLSAATLISSHWILTLYETGVVLDAQRQLLGVGDFLVLILAECAGYEGIGLVVVFLALYCWIFRRDLRFPHAFFLFPIGIAAVWALNSLRIAALISIGAHVSPAVALNGFHSQAGWIAFLLVAVGTMAMSQRFQFFCARLDQTHASVKSEQQLVLALLAPFIALMAASIVASAFAPNDQWLFALKVFAVAATLLWFRNAYAEHLPAPSAISIFAGLAVGVVWIATEPDAGTGQALDAWLSAMPGPLAALWLGLRAFGFVLLIPIAEELAFRGYLHRALISLRIEQVAPGQFGWRAFVVSSLLFGLMHDRWIAGALAGAIFAVVMYRSNRLSDAIAAHMASNGVIMLWAVSMGQWALL